VVDPAPGFARCSATPGDSRPRWDRPAAPEQPRPLRRAP